MRRYSADDLPLAAAEQLYGLPKGLLGSVMHQETRGNPRALSPKGAAGLFQFMPATARQYGINPWDVDESIMGAARMYRELLDKYDNDLPKALAGYNWGQGNVDRKGLGKVPRETRDYIKQVIGRMPQANTQSSEEEDDDALLAKLFPQNENKTATTAVQDPDDALLAELFPASKQSATADATNESDEDKLIRQMGYEPSAIKKSRFYKPNTLSRAQSDPNSLYSQYIANTPAAGVLKGLEDTPIALQEIAAYLGGKSGALSPEDVQFSGLISKLRAQDYAKNRQDLKPDEFDASRLVGNIITPIPGSTLLKYGHPAIKTAVKAAKPVIEAGEKVVRTNIAPYLAKKFGIGGTATTLTTPTDPEDEDFLGQKATQFTTGGIFGAGTNLGTLGIAKGGTYINKARQARAKATRGEALLPEEARLLEDAKKEGIFLGAGDVTNNPDLVRAEIALEEFSPRLGGLRGRQEQGEQVLASVQRRTQESLDAMKSVEYKGLEDIQKIAAVPGKRGDAAKRVLEAVDAAGDDWKRVIKASGNVRLLRAKLDSDQMYEKAYAAADNIRPSLTSSADTVKKLATEAGRDVQQNGLEKGYYAKFNELMDNPNATMEEVRQLSSELKDYLKDAYSGKNALVGTRVSGRLQQLQKAVQNNIEESIRASGDPKAIRLFNRADNFYKTQVAPYKTAQMAKSFSKEGDSDLIFDAFIKSDRENLAKDFYKALDRKGRAAVRAGFISEAAKDATDKVSGVFSPPRFVSELQKLKSARDTFFKGEDKWALDGYINLMAHAKRAAAALENPPTGKRGIPWLISAVQGSPDKIVTATLGISGLGAEMFGTEKGVRQLIALSHIKPNSPQMDKAIARMSQEWGRGAAISTNSNSKLPPIPQGE